MMINKCTIYEDDRVLNLLLRKKGDLFLLLLHVKDGSNGRLGNVEVINMCDVHKTWSPRFIKIIMQWNIINTSTWTRCIGSTCCWLYDSSSPYHPSYNTFVSIADVRPVSSNLCSDMSALINIKLWCLSHLSCTHFFFLRWNHWIWPSRRRFMDSSNSSVHKSIYKFLELEIAADWGPQNNGSDGGEMGTEQKSMHWSPWLLGGHKLL